MDNKRIYQIVGLLVLIIVGLLLWPKLRPATPPQTVSVTDFSSCQTAGGQVTDGEPVTCSYDGKTYSESTLIPDVVLDKPQYGDLVTSPMVVSGKARGTWFFEATMPMTLKDENGKVLFQGPIHAQGDWMTTDYVNFSETVPFDPGDAQYGVLIISKDNPSGDPNKDASYAVPLRFK